MAMYSEGMRPRVGPSSRSAANASTYFVSRLFTDAIFSQDIRSIQLIINRIDGGLPKDVEIGDYQTLFSDCLNELMTYPLDDRLKLVPEDTVMMALCKSLYYLSVQDIYWDENNQRLRRPSTDKKNERDAAMRMILERVGGRKTLVAANTQKEDFEVAEWISELPSGTS